MIPSETVNLIQETVQIVDVVGDYVTLKRRGANYVACCPFHNEKTPSFYVSPSKGIYKCFGCGKAGNAIGFVMEEEHCTYVEALRLLARRYHIEFEEEEESAEQITARQKSESLMLISDYAQKFFAEQLSSDEGRSIGLAYFRKRGMEDATIEKFGLGWAPSARAALIDSAISKGYNPDYLLDAGVAVKREDGSLADKFRERVMFPIHSVSGRVIAFSGRTLRSDNPAKYVNSPETEIYIKSKNLLGIYFAKSEISRLDKCILVEGNIDMVMMYQLGIKNVVASCGTSLTVEQIRLIKRFSENVTIMYDGDSAGIHAALRGINLILAEGMNVKVVLLPDGDDPDSYSRKHTLEEVQNYISESEKDFIEFKTNLLLSEAKNDPLKKANLINDIADTISQIPDPVKRSVYVEVTSAKFGIENSILFERINKTRQSIIENNRKERQREVDVSPQTTHTNEEWQEENKTLAPAEKDLLYFLVNFGSEILNFDTESEYYSGTETEKPTVTDFIREALEADDTKMGNSAYAELYDAYMELYDEGADNDEINKSILNSPHRRLADLVAQLTTQKYPLSVSSFERSLTTSSSWLVMYVPRAILVYAERRLQDRLDSLRKELKTLASDDSNRMLAIMQEIKRIQAARRRINQKIGREKTTYNG